MKTTILIFSFLFSLKAWSQAYLPVQHLKAEDGLASRNVHCIFKDSEGYMWFGAQDGLNCYNGTDWVSYRHLEGDSTSISENNIRQITETPDGNLLVKSRHNLDYFDKKTGRFARARFRGADVQASIDVISLIEIPSGPIMALGFPDSDGRPVKEVDRVLLFKYVGNGVFDFLKTINNNLETGTALYGATANQYWFYSQSYILTDLASNTMQTFSFKKTHGPYLPITPSGRFWYPCLSAQKDSLFESFELPKEVPITGWMNFTVDNHQNIWLETQNKRIYKFDTALKKLSESEAFEADGFRIERQKKPYLDNLNALWIPHRFGVSVVRKQTQYFNNFCYDPAKLDSRSGTGATVYSMAETNNGTIYFIDEKNIFYVLEPESGRVTKQKLPLPSNYRNQIDHAWDHVLHTTKDGNIWIGSTQGLIRFNPARKDFLLFDSIYIKTIHKAQRPSLAIGESGKSWQIDQRGYLWSFDQKKQVYSTDTTRTFPMGSIGLGETHVWICTGSVLTKLNGSGVIIQQYTLPKLPRTQNLGKVAQVLPYEGKVWIGTQDGLLEFNVQTERFRLYTIVDGLPDNIIYSMLPYKNALWMGTHNGLCRFDTKTTEVRNYYTGDGLSHNEFNQFAALKTRDGKFYFGGVNGINAFYPGVLDSLSNLEASHLVWTKFSKLDGRLDSLKVYEGFKLHPSELLELSYADRSFTFRYALLSYLHPSENTYSYYLDGYEKGWNYAGNAAFINYPIIPPGKYTFRVKAMDARGNPGQNELAIPIIVYGPWWNTWWAQVLFSILALTTVLGYGRWRTISLKKQKKLLKQTVRERTAELNKQKSRAEQSEQYKERFLANMSHEIRTPMHAISGMTNILLRNPHLLEQAKFLKAIQQSSGNLLVILNDILDLSKIEAGKIEIRPVPMDLPRVLKNTVDILRIKAEEKGLALRSSIAENVPQQIQSDPTRLSQILLNLVGNAIKFTEKGTITLTVTPESDKLRFAVQDSGIGIPAAELERIFDRYEQAGELSTEKYGGTGLGLSIARQLVELQHGAIWVESREGRGSTFFFELPLKTATGHSVEEGITEEQLKTMAASLSGLRILLAEDEEFNTLIVSDDLSYYIENVRIKHVENGRQAVEAYEPGAFDLILMDVNMPELGGYDAAKAIREIEAANGVQQPVPIIAMTASLLKPEIEQCYAAGMNNYIPKPYTVEELIGVLYKVAGEHEA